MRILMYSHDSYGLGHLRRTLALAEAFVERDSSTSVLILTGSTVSGVFRMSPGIDLIKLPAAEKVANGVYKPSRLSIDFDTLQDLRSSLILSAAESFNPDVFIVDKSPLGMKREVQRTLWFLRSEWPSTLIVLGLRDVLDEPGRIYQHWKERGIDEAIERFYDLILVYGVREVYDPLPEYGLLDETLDRSHYVGYVGRAPTIPEASRSPSRGYVLVTAGGGGDGFHLMKTYLESLRGHTPSFESIVVTGPLMDDKHRRRLERLSLGLRVQLSEFRPDMERLIQDAGAVVSMGGYNTTMELLAAGTPAVIVPRIQPRLEQLIRAERLSEAGLVDMIHPDTLTPGLLRDKVEELLRRDPSSVRKVEIDFSGASRAVDLITANVFGKRSLALEA